MRVLYDDQIFTSQKYGGVSRYYYEIIKEFQNDIDIKIETSLCISNNNYIKNKKFIKHFQFLENIEFKGKYKILTFINRLKSIYKITNKDFDVFHPTNYDPYFTKYITDKPFVLTVHDMTHEKFARFFPKNNTASLNKKLLSEQASKIIAISNSTKNDIIELYDVEASKIEVIYHGNSMVPNDSIVLNIEIPDNYILFVGSRTGYKNFDKFLKASSRNINENGDICIVCIGGGKFNTKELNLFNEYHIENKIFQYDLDDHYLAHFYKNAIMFVFPSLNEGFGMPILEAFACSCPLVCSNTSSFPEIAEEAAEYFDPYSEESIYNAIKKLLGSVEYRNKLIENGTKRLKQFSWKETAKKTKKVYESVLKEDK